MAYVKLNLTNGTVFTAEHVAHMEAGIANAGGDTSGIFNGKTASFYGDSLTEVNWHYTKGYHQWVKEILGLASYKNYGVSGYKVSDVLNKVNSVNDTADIIFVMVGVNDVQFDVPLGTLAGLESGTVYGNLNLLCSKLREKYPVKLLVFITPHEQTNYPSDIGVSMYDVAKAVKEVCEKHSIVVYDNFVNSEICTTNLSYWTTDNCHWNDEAHEMVGKNLARFVMDTFQYIYGDTASGDDGGDTHIHSYTGMVTTAATCTTPGVKTFICECGDSYTESIPAVGHTYVGGVCSVCGASKVGITPAIINNSVDSATYEDDTLTLTGLNQTFCGVVFDGATEVAISAESNSNFPAANTSGNAFGWLLVCDGNVLHAIGINGQRYTEQYDFDDKLDNPKSVSINRVLWPTTGYATMKIEGTSANLYFNGTLAHSVTGDAIGYAVSKDKCSSLYGVTIV